LQLFKVAHNQSIGLPSRYSAEHALLEVHADLLPKPLNLDLWLIVLA